MLLTEDILKSIMNSTVSKDKNDQETSNDVEFEDV